MEFTNKIYYKNGSFSLIKDDVFNALQKFEGKTNVSQFY